MLVHKKHFFVQSFKLSLKATTENKHPTDFRNFNKKANSVIAPPSSGGSYKITVVSLTKFGQKGPKIASK